MSSTTDTALGTVLTATRYVLLDFDGPVCSIFPGRTAPLIAGALAARMRSHNVAVPDHVLHHGDPLDVLRYAGRIGGPLTEQVEQALQAAELTAAETALPTPGAAEFLTACHRTGRSVAVVSNNSAPAVYRYIDKAGLATLVAHIEGRDPHDLGLMKPHPALLLRAIRALGGRSEATVLIGDSATDLEAAQAAGIPSVGYANKAGKAERLAGAGAVFTSMTELAATVARV